MSMKKQICSIILIIIGLLTACGNQKGENGTEEAFFDYQRGFMGGWGNKLLETPDGYYLFPDRVVSDYLYFMDKEMKEVSFVCSKPECMHNEESVENKERCDAYFSQTSAVNYYNGKVYIAADNSQKPGEHIYVIYELEPDGSNRKKIYTGDGTIHSFCIHRGNIVAYEKKYTEESPNPIVSIVKFPVESPEKKEVLYEADEYEQAEINFMECYENYCYFWMIGDGEEKNETHGMIVNLDTKEVKDCYEFANAGLIVGKDRIYCRNITERNDQEQTWKDEYYECSLDGEIKRKITEEDFEPLKRGAIFEGADDQYIYFSDIEYGGNALPEEERKFYIYTYDGELAGTVPFHQFSEIVALLPGNRDYLFFADLTSSQTGEEEQKDTFGYHRIDKSKIGGGKELTPEKILNK